MNLVVLCNPRSGRGKAVAAADRCERALRADGHAVRTVHVGPGRDGGAGGLASLEVGASEEIPALLADADALVIVGGDGTLHHNADLAVRARVPIHQLPLGTENLFAREFGMDGRLSTLRGALEQRRVVPVDVGRCNGRPFVLMCSVGPDANLIHRVARVRRRSIGHWSYVAPTLAEFASHSVPPLRISVDGRTVVDGRRGLVVVANSRQYALRLDPALHASMTDGLLDVVFFPFESRVRLIGWLVAARLRRHVHARSLVYRQGRTVSIEALECIEPGPHLNGVAGAGRPAAFPFQIDGEAPGVGPCPTGRGAPAALHGGFHQACTAATPVSISVEPGALRVLVPPARRRPSRPSRAFPRAAAHARGGA